MEEVKPHDPQLDEIQRQQSLQAAQAKIGDAMANEQADKADLKEQSWPQRQ